MSYIPVVFARSLSDEPARKLAYRVNHCNLERDTKRLKRYIWRTALGVIIVSLISAFLPPLYLSTIGLISMSVWLYRRKQVYTDSLDNKTKAWIDCGRLMVVPPLIMAAWHELYADVYPGATRQQTRLFLVNRLRTPHLRKPLEEWCERYWSGDDKAGVLAEAKRKLAPYVSGK